MRKVETRKKRTARKKPEGPEPRSQPQAGCDDYGVRLRDLQQQAGNVAVQSVLTQHSTQSPAGAQTRPPHSAPPHALTANIRQKLGNQWLPGLVAPQRSDPSGPEVSLRRSETRDTTQAEPESIGTVIAGLSGPKINMLNSITQIFDAVQEHLDRPAPPKTAMERKEWKSRFWHRLRDTRAYQWYKETGSSITTLVATVIGWTRTLIEDLTAIELGVTRKILPRIKGYYHRRLNAFSPYYTQMANLNFLWKGKRKETASQAWKRTCNMTSLGMALQALGVTPSDFAGEKELLAQIAHQLEPGFGSFADLEALRMPDFLQLVAIYTQYQSSSGADLDKRVSRARNQAARLISTSLDVFVEVAKHFNVKMVKRGFIPSYGSQKSKFKKKIAEKRQQLRKKHKAKTITDDELKAEMRRLDKELAELPNKLTKYTAAKYKERVLRQMTPWLNAGGQVVINLPGHYVRLEDIGDEGLVFDDPASKGKNFPMAWPEANKRGYLRSYQVFMKE